MCAYVFASYSNQNQPWMQLAYNLTWAKRDRQKMNQSDLTRTIFQSILRHLFLWFHLISAYCLPFQMFLPFNRTLLLESGLCKAIKMLFLLSFSHTHPYALSLEPVQTLYLCLNLLKMIDDIDKTCLKATKAEFLRNSSGFFLKNSFYLTAQHPVWLGKVMESDKASYKTGNKTDWRSRAGWLLEWGAVPHMGRAGALRQQH